MSDQEHPNATLVRQGYEALQRGDVNWLQEHLADDVVWHVGGKSVMAGDYHGKNEVLNNFLGRQTQAMGGPPNITLNDVVGNDRHVVAFGDATLDDPDGGSVSWKIRQHLHRGAWQGQGGLGSGRRDFGVRYRYQQTPRLTAPAD